MADIIKLESLEDVKFISSGIKEIDELVGGGFPRRRITELVGVEGIGKSTVVSICAATLSNNGKVLYVDAEQSLNKARVAALGGDLKKIDYTALYELEKASELVVNAVGDYDAIIIDSIATLTPRNILDGELGEANIGLYARQMAKWMKKLKPALNASNCALICVNQYRQSPDMYKPRYVPGGTAYNYALDLRLELASTPSKDKIMDGKQRVGHWVRVNVTKSRVSTPYLETRFKLIYNNQP